MVVSPGKKLPGITKHWGKLLNIAAITLFSVQKYLFHSHGVWLLTTSRYTVTVY